MRGRSWNKEDLWLLSLFEEGLFPQIVAIENGRFVCMSDSFARLFGYTSRELIDSEALQLIASDERVGILDRLSELYQDSCFRTGPVRLETRGTRKDGTQFPFEYWAIQGKRHSRNIWIIPSFADITERKKEEKVTLEIQERFRTAFSYAAVGMALVGINGRLLDMNYALCEILGYSEAELEEMTFQSCLSSGQLETYLEACTSLLIGEVSSVELELKLIHKLGTAVWGLLNATLVRDGDGKPLYYILQLQDVTKRKEAEELLRKSDKLSAVGQLAAGVAHEVRNPLTVLKGFAQMLQRTDGGNRQYYQLMLSEVERIESIIGEFLRLAKPQDTQFRDHDLDLILQDVIALIDTKAIMNNVIIRHNLDGRSIPMQCDDNQLKQVFINMLQNAMEAMPAGGEITISIDVTSLADQGEVSIQITDQGCGIEEDRIAKLGEPFYSSKEKGTGLGLMVSYKIIQKHGGRIRVTSAVDEGTTFLITLPVAQNQVWLGETTTIQEAMGDE